MVPNLNQVQSFAEQEWAHLKKTQDKKKALLKLTIWSNLGLFTSLLIIQRTNTWVKTNIYLCTHAQEWYGIV